jgi:L-ascorbate metabolism protein UlaG (beta-lactamase superfamily)
VTALRWLGHSTVVFDLDDVRIVTDPMLRRRVLHLRRTADVPSPESVDAVLISHLHYDHLDLPSLARIGVDTQIVVPRGGAKTLRGFERVREVAPGMHVEVGGLPIRVVEAEHDGRRQPIGGHVPAVGYVLEGDHSIYFAGDTDLFDGMRELAGGLDLALLPVAGWGRTLPAGHMDAHKAVRALELLEPRHAVPVHWGTFVPFRIGALGGSATAAEDFRAEAASRVPGVAVHVLPVGGSFELRD